MNDIKIRLTNKLNGTTAEISYCDVESIKVTSINEKVSILISDGFEGINKIYRISFNINEYDYYINNIMH